MQQFDVNLSRKPFFFERLSGKSKCQSIRHTNKCHGRRTNNQQIATSKFFDKLNKKMIRDNLWHSSWPRRLHHPSNQTEQIVSSIFPTSRYAAKIIPCFWQHFLLASAFLWSTGSNSDVTMYHCSWPMNRRKTSHARLVPCLPTPRSSRLFPFHLTWFNFSASILNPRSCPSISNWINLDFREETELLAQSTFLYLQRWNYSVWSDNYSMLIRPSLGWRAGDDERRRKPHQFNLVAHKKSWHVKAALHAERRLCDEVLFCAHKKLFNLVSPSPSATSIFAANCFTRLFRSLHKKAFIALELPFTL